MTGVLMDSSHAAIQGRNFTEAMKAMAAVAPHFGLVPLKKMAYPKATVALMPQLTTFSSVM